MDNQDRIKLFADACKESFEVAKDVRKQQDIVREDLQRIFNAVLRANAEELKTCNCYITNKYPDLVQFTPHNCFLTVVPSNVVEDMSITQLQNTLLVAAGALNNMLASYKFLKIIEGGAKIVVKQAIEGTLKL